MAASHTFFLGIILLLCWISIGDAEYMKYKDPKQPVGVRIKDLMNRMTLAEKIGQMAQIERKVATTQVMKDYFIGNMNRLIFLFIIDPLLCYDIKL